MGRRGKVVPLPPTRRVIAERGAAVVLSAEVIRETGRREKYMYGYELHNPARYRMSFARGLRE
jgi:hypothetical protein